MLEFLVSASVAEFKGPVVFGVVRLAQVSMELARVEASFSGLTPGRHGWSINEYGDLTKGAASTGKVYNHPGGLATDQVCLFFFIIFYVFLIESVVYVIVFVTLEKK